METERLTWQRGRGGIARLNDIRVQLPGHVPPGVDIDLPDLEALDYAPDSRASTLQPIAEPRRDMFPNERAACARYLRRLCAMEG